MSCIEQGVDTYPISVIRKRNKQESSTTSPSRNTTTITLVQPNIPTDVNTPRDKRLRTSQTPHKYDQNTSLASLNRTEKAQKEAAADGGL